VNLDTVWKVRVFSFCDPACFSGSFEKKEHPAIHRGKAQGYLGLQTRTGLPV
jgi:hypothetical protein